MRLAKCYFFFLRKNFPRLPHLPLFQISQVLYYPLLHEDNIKSFAIFFCYDYFEDLLAPTTFAKNFGFLAGVVSKIFVIKNALATNCYVTIEIITKNQFLRNV